VSSVGGGACRHDHRNAGSRCRTNADVRRAGRPFTIDRNLLQLQELSSYQQDRDSMVQELVSNPEPKRILVVEDEVLIRCLICDDLREAGFVVVEAENADEASSYLASGAPVDLIFSDVHMPGSMDGLDLARRIRNERPCLPRDGV
jgi:PleD family two-component response regulator